jgi:hypothetical protein
MLDGKTLQSLLNSYPKGNVWYIDDKGFFSSLDQINDLERFDRGSPFGSRRLVPASDVTKQMAEATILSQIFHKARQIIFLPLWDAAGGRIHLLYCLPYVLISAARSVVLGLFCVESIRSSSFYC